MEEQVYSQGVVDALAESNEFLQEEVSRLRNNNRMLRSVISAQRKTATVLRDQVAIAAANDEAFKGICQESVVEYHTPYSANGEYHVPDHVGDTVKIFDAPIEPRSLPLDIIITNNSSGNVCYEMSEKTHDFLTKIVKQYFDASVAAVAGMDYPIGTVVEPAI